MEAKELEQSGGSTAGDVRHRSASRLHRRLPWLEPALWLAVPYASVLVLGGVLPWSTLLLAVLALLALGLTQRRHAVRLSAPVWGLLGCALVAALQCVPLPLAWLASLDPVSAEIHARARELTQSGVGASISLDPEATRLEVLKALSYAGVWVGGAALRRRFGLQLVLAALGTLGLVCGAVTALHRVLSLEKVYGLYAPEYALSGSLGPLLNPNSQAGLFLLAGFAAVGLALHRQASWRQMLLAWGSAAVLFALLVLTGSRGALLGLAVGIGIFGLVARADLARSFGRFKANTVGAVVAAISATALSVAAMTTTLATQIWDDSIDKIQLWVWGFYVALEHPWFGVGRGAFGAEVGRVGAGPGEVVFSHAENWVVEWIAGYGLIAGTLVVVGLVRLLWPAPPDRRWQVSDYALWAGLVALALQNLTDLSFEVPGVAIPFLFGLAATSERTKGPGNDGASPGGRHPRKWDKGWVVVGALGAGIVWCLVSPVQLAHRERSELGKRFWRQREEWPKLDEIRAAVQRHPADAHLIRLGAQRLLHDDPARGLGWLNASLLQAPRAGRTYILLAQTLRRLGRTDQALLSLREAVVHNPELSPTVAILARRWSPEHALRAVPDGPRGVGLLLELAGQTASVTQRIELLNQAYERDPTSTRAAEMLVAAELEGTLTNTAPCADPQREQCIRQIGERLDALALQKINLRQVELRGRWFLAQDRIDDALVWLGSRCPRTPEGRECLALMLESAARKDTTAVSNVADLIATSCGSTVDCTSDLRRIVAVFRARGELLSALAYQARITAVDPSWPTWLEQAELARAAGHGADALRWFERAEREAAGDVTALEKIAAARRVLGPGAP